MCFILGRVRRSESREVLKMVDWNDIKRAFEKEMNKQEDLSLSSEERLLRCIANFLAVKNEVSAVTGYRTDDVLAFLQKGPAEIKSALGGEWSAMDDSIIENLIYSLTKKVKKSADFLG